MDWVDQCAKLKGSGAAADDGGRVAGIRPVAITLARAINNPVTAPLWTRSSNAATGDIEPADLSCILPVSSLTAANVATL